MNPRYCPRCQQYHPAAMFPTGGDVCRVCKDVEATLRRASYLKHKGAAYQERLERANKKLLKSQGE